MKNKASKRAQEWYSIIKNKDAYYTTYHIPKKNGEFRIIENPSDTLKKTQREILDHILQYIPLHKGVHGFVKNRSIYTNASQHLKAVCIVNLDIEDFFPSVKQDIVLRELSRFVRTPKAITELVTYKGRIPQGAPTSPYIANIVCVMMDRKLGGLAKRFNATYTRYADDITFSSRTNKDLHKIIPKAHSIIKKEGFNLNFKKINVMRRGMRMVVTGIVVNDKLNVPRDLVRKFRAELHQTHITNSIEDMQHYHKLAGYQSFIAGANQKKGEQFSRLLQRTRSE